MDAEHLEYKPPELEGREQVVNSLSREEKIRHILDNLEQDEKSLSLDKIPLPRSSEEDPSEMDALFEIWKSYGGEIAILKQQLDNGPKLPAYEQIYQIHSDRYTEWLDYFSTSKRIKPSS